MPQLGESIAEATIVSFLIQPGELIQADPGHHRSRNQQVPNERGFALSRARRGNSCETK